MTIEKPSAADLAQLTKGSKIKVNGRRYTVEGDLPATGGTYLTGVRGGWANLVPSTCGKAVQLTTLSSRDWIRTLEIL